MADDKSTTGTLLQREMTARRVFVARLRAADASWSQIMLISMAHAAANEIERLCEMLGEAEAAYEAAVAMARPVGREII